MGQVEIEKLLSERAAEVEAALAAYLPAQGTVPEVLRQSMFYSVFAPAKRLRPFLVLAAAEAVGGAVTDAMPVACAVEFIHTYSLIHDDLPCMDDDDMRRGKPSNHVIYGEAVALLAGDALLTLAFDVVSSGLGGCDRGGTAGLRVIRELAAAAGAAGMVGGQVADLASEDRTVTPEELEFIHRHKTGRLFRACARAGGLVGGAPERELVALDGYAEDFGLAFQIVDDILDVVGDEKVMGKKPGSDVKRKKATYVSVFGLETAREQARRATERAKRALEPLGKRGQVLAALADYVLSRQR